MAWTIAVILALVGFSGALAYLSSLFSEEKQGLKVLFISMTLAMLVVTTQIVKIIVEDKASSAISASLVSLMTATLLITSVIFFFFVSYLLLSYTRGSIRAMKEAKNQKEVEMWGKI